MKFKEQLSAELKEAMKARDQVRVDTIRATLSAFTYKRTEVGKEELTDEEELAVIQKQVKQRNDSIAEYTKAGRTELMEKEVKERDILMTYLPAQKSEADVLEAVRKVIAEAQPQERNPGGIMKLIMPQMKGVADGNLVRRLVTEELNKG
ncbi:MAG: GatB/YqeY domain-containing protein [Cyanobacteria bacterium SZAS LIN-5]|jgi:uncharacterized protein|nr:GatB/YqeY domain-containing protein [Cyanobacteria bacterium SZAS LIN-5]RTL40114.1 MAG: GatB/YqeY domain-containing protein [Candidatus Melainabacteria bacterium]